MRIFEVTQPTRGKGIPTDFRVPVPRTTFDELGIEPAPVSADYAQLHAKHPDDFADPAAVRLHVEEVLQRPDAIGPANQADHRLVARWEANKAVFIEIVRKGGKYRVQSAYILTKHQENKLRNEQY